MTKEPDWVVGCDVTSASIVVTNDVTTAATADVTLATSLVTASLGVLTTVDVTFSIPLYR